MWGLARQGCGPYCEAPRWVRRIADIPSTKQGPGPASWAHLRYFCRAAGCCLAGEGGQEIPFPIVNMGAHPLWHDVLLQRCPIAG